VKIPAVVVLMVLAVALVILGLALTGCGDADGPDSTVDMSVDSTSTPTTVPTFGPGPSSSPAATLTGSDDPENTGSSELSITRYEEDRLGLSWTGVWIFAGSARDSGGTSRYTESPGSSVTVEFTGVSLVFVTRTGRNLGRARMTVDDGLPVTVDCYSPTWGYQQVLWATDPLEPGPHTVKIECAGTADPASSGQGIYIDAFVVAETPEMIPAEAPDEAPEEGSEEAPDSTLK
jgi:hypothetical protein